MTDTSKEAVVRLALFGTEGAAFMAPAKDGRYVRATDYDALAQRCADLEEENASLTGQAMIHHKMIRMVAADVEKYKRRAERVESESRRLEAAQDTVCRALAAASARVYRAEAERDAIAAAMVEATAKLAEQYWGAGHHADQIRALTPADALAKLDQIRAEERAAGRREGMPSVDDLAQIIRCEDGDNSKGAGELAEAILAAMEKERGE